MAGSTQISSASVQAVEHVADQANGDKITAEYLAKSDLWIFRDGKREFSGPVFLRELEQRLAARNSLLDCLIQAGELESAIADSGSASVTAAAALTDALADRLCAGNFDSSGLCDLVRRIDVPTTISVSPPEGFTYYALHPLDFARAAEQVSKISHAYAVIGIRSIGTTLSAVTAAALRRLGKRAPRITARPDGHPYSRNATFLPQERAWIAQQLSNSAEFLIVDEGPGRSGSTFLSVAEALNRAGVPRNQMTIIGSRTFDVSTLCAQDAVNRWRDYSFIAAPSSLSTRFADFKYIGGGDWRRYFCDGEQGWPESWTQMERFKVLSPDCREFIKFEGMGRIGKEARDRAFTLAQAGFLPSVTDIGDGFLSYAAVAGKPLEKRNLNTEILETIARYCAFRSTEFAWSGSYSSELEHMVVHNVQEEFGHEIRIELNATAPLTVDGRMQPHEWIVIENARILKTDAISHGDNHFFPGPCGIAWDLAGVVEEWDLGPAAMQFLLNKFQQLSGIDARADFHAYRLAYCVFRLGFCKMARSTVLGSQEEYRLDAAYRHYRARAAQLLESFGN